MSLLRSLPFHRVYCRGPSSHTNVNGEVLAKSREWGQGFTACRGIVRVKTNQDVDVGDRRPVVGEWRWLCCSSPRSSDPATRTTPDSRIRFHGKCSRSPYACLMPQSSRTPSSFTCTPYSLRCPWSASDHRSIPSKQHAQMMYPASERRNNLTKTQQGENRATPECHGSATVESGSQ